MRGAAVWLPGAVHGGLPVCACVGPECPSATTGHSVNEARLVCAPPLRPLLGGGARGHSTPAARSHVCARESAPHRPGQAAPSTIRRSPSTRRGRPRRRAGAREVPPAGHRPCAGRRPHPHARGNRILVPGRPLLRQGRDSAVPPCALPRVHECDMHRSRGPRSRVGSLRCPGASLAERTSSLNKRPFVGPPDPPPPDVFIPCKQSLQCA